MLADPIYEKEEHFVSSKGAKKGEKRRHNIQVGSIDEEDYDEDFPQLAEGEDVKNDPVDQARLTSEHLKFKSFMVTNKIPSPRKLNKSNSQSSTSNLFSLERKVAE